MKLSKTELFQKFLQTKNIKNEFEYEILENHIDDSHDLQDDEIESELYDFYNDLEDFSELLDNGYFFFYKGKNKNSITDVNWSNMNKQWKMIEKCNHTETKLDYLLIEHNSCWVVEPKEYSIGDSICFLNDWYIITERHIKNSFIAMKININGSLSGTKGIILGNSPKTSLIEKKTFKKKSYECI